MSKIFRVTDGHKNSHTPIIREDLYEDGFDPIVKFSYRYSVRCSAVRSGLPEFQCGCVKSYQGVYVRPRVTCIIG